MGFERARHTALAERLNELLSSQSQETSPSPQTNAATTSTIDSLEEKAISYLQDFSVEGVLVEDPAEATAQNSGPEDLESSLNDAEQSPVINLVDRILMQALALGASDIHVEPQQAGLQLRFRQDGVLLSTALTRQKVLPDMALSMLSIGEETGEMDQMLSKVADFYEDEVSASVKALTSMLEPAMIVVVGGIVGSILLAMYLPMFTVFDQIQ